MDSGNTDDVRELPRIGFGTADISGNAEEVVYHAIKAGFRLIDTAKVYETEIPVGKAIRTAIENKIVRREELFVQTKLEPGIHGYENTLKAFDEQMEALQLDYIDMYLIHWPVSRGSEFTYRSENAETWKAFHELKKKGKILHCGVCNFLERHILQLADDTGLYPSINQLELHPGFQQIGLVNFCRERGIKIEAWSPLGRGILNEKEYINMAGKYEKDTAQLALRWSIQKGFIPLTRTTRIERIDNNLNVFDFEIKENDMQKIDGLNTENNHLDIWSYKRQQMY